MDVFASMPIKVAKGHTVNSRRTGWAVPSREGREPAAQESGAPLPPVTVQRGAGRAQPWGLADHVAMQTPSHTSYVALAS